MTWHYAHILSLEGTTTARSEVVSWHPLGAVDHHAMVLGYFALCMLRLQEGKRVTSAIVNVTRKKA